MTYIIKVKEFRKAGLCSMILFQERASILDSYLIQFHMNSLIPYFQKLTSDWQPVWQRVYFQALEKCDFNAYPNPVPYIKHLASLYVFTVDETKSVSCSTLSTDDEMSKTDVLYNMQLTVPVDSQTYMEKNSIISRLKDLYLVDPGVYEFLKKVPSCDIKSGRALLKKTVKPETYSQILDLLKCSANYRVISDACKTVVNTISKQLVTKGRDLPKDVTAIYPPADLRFEEFMCGLLPDKPLLLCHGAEAWINPKTCLTECKYPIDFYADWELLSESKHDVLQIDLTPLYYWLEDKFRLVQGVNTPVLLWFEDSYSCQLPSGKRLLNVGFDTFMNIVHQETIFSLLSNNITTLTTNSTVVGITRDYIYVQPQRKSYTRLVYRTAYGKTFEFPVMKKQIQAKK